MRDGSDVVPLHVHIIGHEQIRPIQSIRYGTAGITKKERHRISQFIVVALNSVAQLLQVYGYDHRLTLRRAQTDEEAILIGTRKKFGRTSSQKD